ncbi:hypothetical protein QQS21_004387 [Conoideocrella luteorostrata]|uniref:Polyketide synthase n=1 Tax=Conoideocrella luteorostrata TaxID=1105319 RepID=A0AAJ0CTY0_9HYPO|nr:hypothetical protein QQS21_004387 [Conoideocrella luteorostrata]
MDPQMRLTLESVYEALEAGGHRMDTLRGSNTAVYVGLMLNDYEILMSRDLETMAKYHIIGTARTMMSSRISYFFDWHGPSLTIDTACSSSIIALHQAVQQLRSGQSEVAVVAAANLIFDMTTFIAMSKFQMLSPSGQCRMWDAAADGYARGEGVAAIVLKTRQAAESDGDDIECIIRETALNQDGKTTGPTMPSPSAQAQLMRDCYHRAGLDLSNPAHRPQFFEAHGTGTPAGDPVEAEAISSAFFGIDNCEQDSLLVGSIKTVIGHTEAAAGLAGLLKAVLALKHSTIPPNMLFTNLSPAVAPFYTHLRIPTCLTPWPALPDGVPRRASVNSFGFGGANGHVILESYAPAAATKLLEQSERPQDVFTPFVFSAASVSSLKSYLYSFSQHLSHQNHNEERNLRDIACTLFARRTELPVATAIGARSVGELIDLIEAKLDAMQNSAMGHAHVRPRKHSLTANGKSRVLGVFTGQGAQWAQMGLDLITVSPKLRSTMEKLQLRLNKLPSLLQELQKDASSSRASDAEISQPLCTAIQILLVDLLQAAGIELHAVIGHSSGEIAAAYAAGYISAEDAICIAYYRGRYSCLARGSDGRNGSMMAVGTTYEDVEDLLGYPEFIGRACVAAVNSATSVTLSGDHDAIKELQVIFQDENKFARILKVNKAYHSSHMLAASTKYCDALAALNIHVGSGNGTSWFSSVNGCKVTSHDFDQLKGLYWDCNMKNRVLFMQAVEGACRDLDYFDMAVEIGPHPALQGPVLETVQLRHARPLPYVGLLRRDTSAITSVANGLRLAWVCLGGDVVELKRYDEYFSGMDSQFKMVKNLPAYAWDHEEEYWYESRQARATRLRPGPAHELLGHLTPDSTPQDMRWRNILRFPEVPWLTNHKLQDVAVFPATGYIVSVLEAALFVSLGSPVKYIVLSEIEIHSALVFESDDANVEILLSMTDIKRNGTESIETTFKYHATSGRDTDLPEIKCSGHVSIQLGNPSLSSLPSRPPRQSNLKPVRKEEFYKLMTQLEYGYSGQFATLNSIERKLGAVTGVVDVIEPTNLLIHPGVLDTALHSILLSHTAPDDGEYSELHIPRYLRTFTVNPSLCTIARDTQTSLAINTVQSMPYPYPRPNMICDVDIYPEHGQNAMIQAQGLECVRISKNTAADDVELFSDIIWDVAEPDLQLIQSGPDLCTAKLEILIERAAGVIMKYLQKNHNQSARLASTIREYLFHHSRVLEMLSDTLEDIRNEGVEYLEVTDIKRIFELGEKLTNILLNKGADITSSVVSVQEDNWFSQSPVVAKFTRHLGLAAKQLAHRNPRMNIIEIATKADTARVTTKTVIDTIGSTLATYTVLDANATSVEGYEEVSKSLLNSGVTIKQADISSDSSWGRELTEQLYDLMIVSIEICSVPDLRSALQNMRRLIRPGGHLLMLLPCPESAFSVLFNAYPQFWLDGSSALSETQPVLTATKWDNFLRQAGYSGIDSSTANNSSKAPFSITISQAIDSRINILRDPLTLSGNEEKWEFKFQNLIILNAKGDEKNDIFYQLPDILTRYFDKINVISSITEVLTTNISLDNATFLSLADIEGSLFANLNESIWIALRTVLLKVQTLMWVTNDCVGDNSHANMILGLVRSAARDNPTLDYLLLDVESTKNLEHTTIARTLLRHKLLGHWRQRDENITIPLENELLINKDGKLIIPRLIANTELNNRYNSNYRQFSTIKSLQDVQNLCLATSDLGWDVMETPQCSTPNTESAFLQLRCTHSLLSSLRITDYEFMFLMLGRDSISNDLMVYLSPKNCLVANAPKDLSVCVTVSAGLEEAILTLVAYHLLAGLVLEGLAENDHVLAYEPSADFSSILLKEARALGVKVTIASTTANKSKLPFYEWISVHHADTHRVISKSFKKDYLAFIDMSPHLDSAAHYIRSSLPVGCKSYSMASLFRNGSRELSNSRRANIANKLAKAVAMATHSLTSDPISTPTTSVISLDRIGEYSHHLSELTIVNWYQSTKFPVTVRPVETQIAFRKDHTYWLVGLTGDLGLSLCEWMIQHGARHFLITSRHPNIQESWLNEMKDRGAIIAIHVCDVTIKEQIQAVYQQAMATLPPVAGVAQGAMVLQDAALQDMTLEKFLAVTKPKVEGSIYLNDLFQDNTLEFFVFFSSISSVVGNFGQANYAAANSFMASLAKKRRRKNLAASIMHIGPIFGIGYISRVGGGAIMGENLLQRVGSTRTSERQFHQHFAEAVLAGKPNSTAASIEIVTGVRKADLQNGEPKPWLTWPRMSHLVAPNNGSHASMAGREKLSRVPIKDQISEANSRDQVFDIIWDSFTCFLGAHFQINIGKLSKVELGNMCFDQMGIDSLAAVEIRGWLMANLEVKIPVWTILNGTSVNEIVTTASVEIPSRLTPNLDCGSSPTIEGDSGSQKSYDEKSSNEDFSPETELRPHKILDSVIIKSIPISFTQSRFYPSGLFLEDKVGLNHILWARIQGQFSPYRLEKAVQTVGKQHEILRTAFFNSKDGKQMQHIMKRSRMQLEYRGVQDESEVANIGASIQKTYVYDVASGDTLRVILLNSQTGEHFLIVGAHPLVLDATSLIEFFNLLAIHYTKPDMPAAPLKQFADVSERQNADYAQGKFRGELN